MFKYLLVALLIVSSVRSQSKVNPVDTCLNNFYGAMDKVLVAAQQGVTSNWLDMAKNILFAGADAIGDYEDCAKIQGSDCVQWVKDTWTAEQQKCLGLMQDFVAKCKKANDDRVSGQPWSTVSADLVAVFQALRDMNECF